MDDIVKKEYIKIDSIGNKFYYSDKEMNILHREDGPAVKSANGYKAWWVNGYRHRIDGPAIEYADGDKSWWVNGKRHREDGPAIEYTDGDRKWYLNNKRYTEQEFNKMVHKPTCNGKIVEIDGVKYKLEKWYH